MRTVELVAGVRSSVLGFGCAPVLGAIGPRAARDAIACALDCGVTHFDVARSYGYGEAERFLGQMLCGRRDQVVIASKFGIRATGLARLMRPAKPLVRAVREYRARIAKSRKLGSEMSAPKSDEPTLVRPISLPPNQSSPTDRFHCRVAITPASMRESLDASLRALRTDYLDLLFIHEPLQAIDDPQRLVDEAEKLKKKGKIRGFGLAFNWAQIDYLQDVLKLVDLWQFDASPHSGHYDHVRQTRGNESNVLFSPFRSGSVRVAVAEMTPADILGRIYKDMPNSVVLCSMFRPEHIRENAAVAGTGSRKFTS